MRKLLLSTALLGLIATPAYAQVDEIIVTARKKSESVQDVPISITVTTGADLVKTGVKGLEELSQSLPAVNISKGGASDQLYIRGIGSGFNGGFEQAVGTYVDGVYYGRSRNTRSSFMDAAQVEVLKGPQTTFFGNSSIAGALSITSRSPGEEFGGNASILWTPEFDETDIQAGVDIPVSDTLKLRIAGRKYDTNGYYTNTNTGGTAPVFDDWGGRITAVWRPTDNFDLNLKYATGQSKGRGVFTSDVFECPVDVSLPGAPRTRPCPANLNAFPAGNPSRIDGEINFTNQVSDTEPTNSEYDALALTMNYDFGDLTLTSVTGRNTFEQYESQDLDQSELLIFQANQFDEFDSISQEFRLSNNAGEKLNWLAGVYYQKQNIDFDANLSPFFIPPVANFNAADPTTLLVNKTLNISEEETMSAFASVNYAITDSLRIDAGLRYTKVDKDFTISNIWGTFPGGTGEITDRTFTPNSFVFNNFAQVNSPVSTNRSDDDFLPSIGIEYDTGIDGLLYANFKQGFKAGGFNYSLRTISDTAPVGAANNVDSLNFGPEQVNAYEAGYKGSFADGRVTTNINLFYSDYTGVQQSVLDATTFVFSVANAAESSTKGIEFEGIADLSDNFRLSSNITLMDAQFDNFVGACSEDQNQRGTCGAVVNGVNVSGQDLSGHETTFAPSISGFLRAEYDHKLSGDWGLSFDGTMFFTDGYHIQSDFDPNIFVKAFQTFNGRIALTPPSSGQYDWELALIGKNLTNVTRPFFCNDLSASPGSYRCSLNPPRSFAVQASVNF